MDEQARQDDIVYGEVTDSLVFIPKEEAIELGQVYKALRTANTWGEFKERSPTDKYKEAVEFAWEVLEEEGAVSENNKEPDAEAEFDPDHHLGYENMDWPSWPAQNMLDWVPEEIQTRFGSSKPTPISGDYLYLSPDQEDTIISAMQSYGYACVRDDDLVWMSGGIYLIQNDGQPVEKRQEKYGSENLLQAMLTQSPNLLAGDQVNDAEPRWWLLVASDAGLPGEEGGGDRWSVDHHMKWTSLWLRLCLRG